MGRRGILCRRGWDSRREHAVEEVTREALTRLKGGEPAVGYAIYTRKGKWRKARGKDFWLYAGAFEDPRLRPAGLSGLGVGDLVTGCLTRNGVQFRWDRDPSRPIRVITASIRRLSCFSGGASPT
jgi:hypothetical protein